MILFELIRMAIISIKSSKTRSFLTMLGVIIGVSSVVLLTSIGEGVRAGIKKEFENFGTNVVFVIPGKVDISSGAGNVNPASTLGANTLTQEDVNTIRSLEGVASVAPMNIGGGLLKAGENTTSSTMIIATTPDFFKLNGMTISDGRHFYQNENEESENVVVIGAKAKEALFGDNNPLEETISFRDANLRVVGTLGKSTASLKLFGMDFENIMLIPFNTYSQITESDNIFRVIVQIKDAERISSVSEQIKSSVKVNHSGEEDFTVFKEDDILSIFDNIFGVITLMITGIAAISLVVGGIGIMNIMLVAVSERTREIGVRKAIGATFWHILIQFMTEAVMLSLMGGIIGLLVAFMATKLISNFSVLTPVITTSSITLAFSVSVLVGVVFGVAPAIKAARKNPIEALRQS